MNALISLPFVIFYMITILAIPVLVGVYVYKDAKKHNMDAVLWTLIAILVPGFVGLIIYLVVRSNDVNVNCPKCKKPISYEYSLCPYCGEQLKEFCPNCNSPLENGWVTCPKCGSKLPEEHNISINPLPPKKDKTLVWVIIAIILVPILIFIIGVVGLGVFNVQTTNFMKLNYAHNLNVKDIKEVEIKNWVESCDTTGKGVYLLKIEDRSSNNKYDYYLYINSDSYNKKGYLYNGTTTVLNNDFRINLYTGEKFEDALDYQLAHFLYEGKKTDKTIIYINGEKVEFKESNLQK